MHCISLMLNIEVDHSVSRNLTQRNFTTFWKQLKDTLKKAKASKLTSLVTSSASWDSPGIL